MAAPDFDENLVQGGSPDALAVQRALGKARSVAEARPGAIVIGSDQVADLDGELLGKPGTREAACGQLAKMSGRTINFHTSLALVGEGRELIEVDLFTVRMRRLGPEEIEAYVSRDEPMNCAGSFKIEGLGIALMESMEGADYTSLIGLPLIRLGGMLQSFGINVLTGGG